MLSSFANSYHLFHSRESRNPIVGGDGELLQMGYGIPCVACIYDRVLFEGAGFIFAPCLLVVL